MVPLMTVASIPDAEFKGVSLHLTRYTFLFFAVALGFGVRASLGYRTVLLELMHPIDDQ